MRVSNINRYILSGMNKNVESHKSNIQGLSDVSNSRSQSLAYPQITRLGNYNKPIMNKPSFKGLEETAEEINKNNTYEKNLRLQTLSKKISSAISMVKHPDIVLVGNDEKRDIEFLLENINGYHFQFLMEKIYYINDPAADMTFALCYNAKESGTHINVLDKKSVNILDSYRSETSSGSYFTGKKQFLMYRDNNCLLIDRSLEDGNIENPCYKIFDVKDKKLTLQDINKSNIKAFFESPETTQKKEPEADACKVHTKITFKDIAGLDSQLDRIKKEIIYPIKNPMAYQNRKKFDAGTILYGIPGTGKSLIGEALANEANMSFIKINASELEDRYVGETEANWRKLFDKAIKSQPCLIFIDEFDAIAKRRGGRDVYGDKTLNTVLSLMSNVEKNNYKVFFVAATNNFESLDPAVLRAGRFGNHIEIPAPDLKGCYDIFKLHSTKMKISDVFDAEAFALDLYRRKATGADIAAVVDKAWDAAYERLGIFRKMEQNTLVQKDIDDIIISYKDLDKGLDTVLPEKKGNK